MKSYCCLACVVWVCKKDTRSYSNTVSALQYCSYIHWITTVTLEPFMMNVSIRSSALLHPLQAIVSCITFLPFRRPPGQAVVCTEARRAAWVYFSYFSSYTYGWMTSAKLMAPRVGAVKSIYAKKLDLGIEGNVFLCDKLLGTSKTLCSPSKTNKSFLLFYKLWSSVGTGNFTVIK